MNTPIKGLGKFTPRVDPTLRARLAGGNGKPEPVKAGATVTAVTAAAPPGAQPHAPKVGNSETRQPGPPVRITAELWLEIIDDSEKVCPAFAYLGRDDPLDTLRITTVLNRALWPTAAALARGDLNALRWLVALAVLDRCLTWPSHPILRATSRHLCKAATGEKGQDYQAGLWAAYALRNHALFAIEKLSILKGESERSPVEKFASFCVEVDSARLASWRAKIAANHKSLTKSKAPKAWDH